jgi:hypothetical protein
MTFVHTFVVRPLKSCSSGILGMDFLQQVGTEISVTAQLFYIDPCSFPLRCQGPTSSHSYNLRSRVGSTSNEAPEK